MHYAVSYTRGSPSLSAFIMMNERKVRVRKYCEYDHENSAEKNHQVQMMGEIFANAEHVLDCVGADSDKSNYLMDIMHRGTSLHILWTWQTLKNRPDLSAIPFQILKNFALTLLSFTPELLNAGTFICFFVAAVLQIVVLQFVVPPRQLYKLLLNDRILGPEG